MSDMPNSAGVLLAWRTVQNPMTTASIIEALLDDLAATGPIELDPNRPNRARTVAAVEHLLTNRPDMAQRALSERRAPMPVGPAPRAGSGPGSRPFMFYDPTTRYVWGCGPTLWEAQAVAGWHLVQYGRPDLMAHMKNMATTPAFVEAWKRRRERLPWHRNAAGLAVADDLPELAIPPTPHVEVELATMSGGAA